MFSFASGENSANFYWNILMNANWGSIADWFSAIGTIAAVLVALWPQLKKLKSSELVFQLEILPTSTFYKVVHINIFNLKDIDEIIELDHINNYTQEFYYNKTKWDSSSFCNKDGKQISKLQFKVEDGFFPFVKLNKN